MNVPLATVHHLYNVVTNHRSWKVAGNNPRRFHPLPKFGSIPRSLAGISPRPVCRAISAILCDKNSGQQNRSRSECLTGIQQQFAVCCSSRNSWRNLARYSATNILNNYIIKVALCNRADHYIFALWYVSIFFIFFFRRLISVAADWMSTILPHVMWP